MRRVPMSIKPQVLAEGFAPSTTASIKFSPSSPPPDEDESPDDELSSELELELLDEDEELLDELESELDDELLEESELLLLSSLELLSSSLELL